MGGGSAASTRAPGSGRGEGCRVVPLDRGDVVLTDHADVSTAVACSVGSLAG